MEFELADVKGEFIQSGQIHREVYVRPRKELEPGRGMLWRLLMLPYGL